MAKVGIIGAGIGGLASAIRFAKAGHQVSIFETNSHPGGKINNLSLGEFRWDMGPSVFTAPHYVEDLYKLCEKDFSSFEYKKLKNTFNYFFNDNTRFSLPANQKEMLDVFEKELGENRSVVEKYLNKAKNNYNHIAPIFIEKSLHRYKHLLSGKLLLALARLPKYKLNSTMNEENVSTFKNEKTIQLFNRYATYNGSSPYKSPAMLNMIQHLELNEGIFLPKDGMIQIPSSLHELAKDLGVQFYFNEKVVSVETKNNKVVEIKTTKRRKEIDVVVSNMDITYTYEQLLSKSIDKPTKTLNQERSSSGIVFYWGINGTFPELDVHNMFFSSNYKEEFEKIFESKTISEDPSIYVHITSKQKKEDAPKGKENWFVMISTPIIENQNWEDLVKEVRKNVLQRLSKQLNRDIESLIEEEFVMDPVFIEKTYSAAKGSIYGNSSNNKYAAFYRHPNFNKKVEGLYFAGVTVHPGGGIPLALNSAKIAFECFEEDVQKGRLSLKDR